MARSHPETWLITEKLTLNGQIHGKKVHGRPRTMLLDWLLKTKEGNISYKELKMSAQDRSRRSQWRCKAAIWQNTAETARVRERERERESKREREISITANILRGSGSRWTPYAHHRPLSLFVHLHIPYTSLYIWLLETPSET